MIKAHTLLIVLALSFGILLLTYKSIFVAINYSPYSSTIIRKEFTISRDNYELQKLGPLSRNNLRYW